MFKKIFILIIIALITIVIYKHYKKQPSYINLNELKNNPVINEKNISNDVIDKINSINKNIKNVSYDVDFKINSFIDIRATGILYYEKPKNLRMIAYKLGTDACDIGSNDKIFWYWSRYSNSSNVYFCEHENLYSSGLKVPLNPLWIMESLSLNEIKFNPENIIKYKDYLILIDFRPTTAGTIVKKITLIDPKKLTIIGHYITDLNDNFIVSTEIKEHYEINNIFIPKKIKIIWYDERIELDLNLNNPKINNQIDPNIWKIKSSNEYVNIGK